MTGEPAGAARPGRFDMRAWWLLAGLIVVFAAAPLVVAYLGAALADLNGCAIADAGPTPCVIAGADRGQLVSDMVGFIEFAPITLPVSVMLAFVWASALAISFMAHRRKRNGAADATRMSIRLDYYALVGAALFLAGWATLAGWLPAPLLLLLLFIAIFWAFSLAFALATLLRDRSKTN